MTFLEAAARVLEEAQRPLHYREIVRIAIEKDLLSHIGKTPELAMRARLSAAVRRDPKRSPFVRTGPGVYRLREGAASTNAVVQPLAPAMGQDGTVAPSGTGQGAASVASDGDEALVVSSRSMSSAQDEKGEVGESRKPKAPRARGRQQNKNKRKTAAASSAEHTNRSGEGEKKAGEGAEKSGGQDGGSKRPQRDGPSKATRKRDPIAEVERDEARETSPTGAPTMEPVAGGLEQNGEEGVSGSSGGGREVSSKDRTPPGDGEDLPKDAGSPGRGTEVSSKNRTPPGDGEGLPDDGSESTQNGPGGGGRTAEVGSAPTQAKGAGEERRETSPGEHPPLEAFGASEHGVESDGRTGGRGGRRLRRSRRASSEEDRAEARSASSPPSAGSPEGESSGSQGETSSRSGNRRRRKRRRKPLTAGSGDLATLVFRLLENRGTAVGLGDLAREASRHSRGGLEVSEQQLAAALASANAIDRARGRLPRFVIGKHEVELTTRTLGPEIGQAEQRIANELQRIRRFALDALAERLTQLSLKALLTLAECCLADDGWLIVRRARLEGDVAAQMVCRHEHSGAHAAVMVLAGAAGAEASLRLSTMRGSLHEQEAERGILVVAQRADDALRRAANAPGAPLVDLWDVRELARRLERLGLGVRQVELRLPIFDAQFFEGLER